MKLETETEVRYKNTPAITPSRHRCRERQLNENLWDYDFKEGILKWKQLLNYLCLDTDRSATNNMIVTSILKFFYYFVHHQFNAVTIYKKYLF